MTYTFKIRCRAFVAATLAEVSETYNRERDISGEGASTFPTASVVREGKVIGRLSYNGRIWAPGSDTELIYDNTPS